MIFGAVSNLRNAALWKWVVRLAFLFSSLPVVHGANLTLAWDPATDPAVAGYKVYYGTASRTYGNVLDAGTQTSSTISNLTTGTTYYFAATTYNSSGIESDYSAEATYTPVIVNIPPTLDAIPDMTINENVGLQTVSIYGISSGAFTEQQTLSVSAFSSNPSLVPNPTVDYTSPQQSGTLSFTPLPNSFGAALVTVMVDDGGAVSNTVIRSFTVTVNPANNPPTLDPISNVTINENSSSQTVNLTGISSGAPNEVQTLTVTATSSNPSLIPNPVVNYASPSATATLVFHPVTNALGTATITVTVNDGGTTNATTSQSFTVTVNQVVQAPTALTNAIVAPNQVFRFVLNPPATNGHRYTFALDASAPAGTKIATKRGITSLVWVPSPAQASTTNLIVIQVTDNTTPSLSTNEAVQVVVLDYMSVIGGCTAVQAGQSGSLPISLAASDGVTNFTFTLDFPTTLFSAPTLTLASPSTTAGTVQLNGTNLLVQIRTLGGAVLTGSNLVAQINYQANSGQPSAFNYLGVRNVSGKKPTGLGYVDNVPQNARITVVNDKPLLESTQSNGTRVVRLYGKVGFNYQLQSSTNLQSPSSWVPVTTYLQTNVFQKLTVDGTTPVIFYRLNQQ